MDTTVTDTITPGSDRNVVPIVRDLTECLFVEYSTLKALAFLDASFGLHTEESGFEKGKGIFQNTNELLW